MATDLFNPNENPYLNSWLYGDESEIDLRKFDLATFKVKEKNSLNVVKGMEINHQTSRLKQICDKICDKINQENCLKVRMDRFNPVYIALFETLKNAYEHGNKKDSDKEIVVSANVDLPFLEIAVIDDGGRLHKDFISFVFNNRDFIKSGKYRNFYINAQKAKAMGNCGVGISFAHMYTDDLKYSKAENGGLAVILTKKLDKTD